MFPGAYRGRGCFVQFCAQAHRNRSRLPASVRKCDCAKMHMIPIAYQLAESRPIADQDVTHVNIMRSAPARSVSEAARQRGSEAARQRGSDARQRGRRNPLTVKLSQGRARQGEAGRGRASQRKSGAEKCSKIKGLRRVRGLTWSRDPPRGWPGGGQDDFDTLTGRRSEIFA